MSSSEGQIDAEDGNCQQPQRSRPHVVRSLLFDDKGDLLVMRRDRPDRGTYYVFIGGGVEEVDASWHEAIKREVLEETGAEIIVGSEAYTISNGLIGDAQSLQHFFLCRLVSMDLSRRCGEEYRDKSRGSFEVVTVSPSSEEFKVINLLPREVRDFVQTQHSKLCAEIRRMGGLSSTT